MKFGRVSLEDAEGAILAHSVRHSGVSFKKGRVLTPDDVAALRDAGVNDVVVARVEDDDVPEDVAAGRIASSAAGEHIDVSAAFTGRANLYAATNGVVLVDRERVDRLNLIDESATIATVPPFSVAETKQMLATVKIIPFAAAKSVVTQAVEIAAQNGPLIRIAPFRSHKVGLVSTSLPGTKDAVLDKNYDSLKARLDRLGGGEFIEKRCAHDESAISDSIRELLRQNCEIVLVFGASAIVDRRDAIPAGIEMAGGEVNHFGMPVDPGNLLLMGHVGSVPTVGLPGCARSPKLNGVDWVLERLMADLEVTREDIMRMGVGGLLKEIPTRPQPRAAGPAAGQAKAPAIAALVLAAGQSRRMGKDNKLLADVGGKPMVRHVAEAALQSKARPIIVITGHQDDTVQDALTGLHVSFVHNPDYVEGLSTSLRRGIDALDDDVDGVLICLGDMPGIKPEHLDKLIAAFDPPEERAICVPTHRGKRGNPVLFGRQFFAEMRDVEGDVGAKHLIGEHQDVVCEVAIEDDAIFLDIDTPEALARSGG